MLKIRVLSFKSLCLLSLLILSHIENANSQHRKWIKTYMTQFGLQINETMNGTGHGLQTGLDLSYKYGSSEFIAGIFAQSSFDRISGASLKYKYFIVSEKYFSLYCHNTLMYHHHNSLTDNLNEAYHPNDYNSSVEYEKFNTIADHLGIGSEMMLVKNLYLDLKIGLGGYLSSVVGQDNRDKNVIVRDDKELTFMAGVGLIFRLREQSSR